MTNYDFISYEKTPEDGLQIGIVTLLAFGKLQIKLKHMSKKDGSGTYFAAPSISKTFNLQKQYEDCVLLDSRVEHNALMDYLRKCVTRQVESTVLNPSVFEAPKPSHGSGSNDFDPNEKLPF